MQELAIIVMLLWVSMTVFSIGLYYHERERVPVLILAFIMPPLLIGRALGSMMQDLHDLAEMKRREPR